MFSASKNSAATTILSPVNMRIWMQLFVSIAHTRQKEELRVKRIQYVGSSGGGGMILFDLITAAVLLYEQKTRLQVLKKCVLLCSSTREFPLYTQTQVQHFDSFRSEWKRKQEKVSMQPSVQSGFLLPGRIFRSSRKMSHTGPQFWSNMIKIHRFLTRRSPKPTFCVSCRPTGWADASGREYSVDPEPQFNKKLTILLQHRALKMWIFNSAWIPSVRAAEGMRVFRFNEGVVRHLDSKADN